MTMQKIKQTYKTKASDVKAKALTAHYPAVAEPALIHPLNTSIVKIRDNGMIDVFVDNDNGIRIDPKTKTINLTGGAIQEHGGNKTAWLQSYTSKVTKDWSVNTGGNVNVTAKGSATIHSSKSLTLQSGGAMTIKSGGHMTITAPMLDLNL